MVCSGVGSVRVDRQAAGADERSSSLGRDPAGLPPGVGSDRVRLQPRDSHRLPAHLISSGTTPRLPSAHGLPLNTGWNRTLLGGGQNLLVFL